jgi:hypothetical protein
MKRSPLLILVLIAVGCGDQQNTTDMGQPQASEAAREDQPVPELESVLEAVGPPPDEVGISRMMITLLLMMIVVTAISSITSLYLYWWRRKLTDKERMLAPENFLDALHQMHAADKEAVNSLHSLRQNISDSKESTSDSISDLRKTFLSLRDLVKQRDAQIEKLQGGYDVVLLRRFLERILLVEDAILSTRREFPGSTEALDIVHESLQSALEECDIEPFEPSIGEKYSSLRPFVADDPDYIDSVSEDQVPGTIASVDQVGSRARIGDEKWAAIRRAEVTVYQAAASIKQKEGR